MNTITLALRNALRHSRRSAATLAAIALGASATLLFGGFMTQVMLSFQTSTVQRAGHLTLYRSGYFDYGTGNPGAYGIADYREIIAKLKSDPQLAPMVREITPTVTLLGIAGNPETPASKSFFGLGVVPSDRSRMRLWDEYHLMNDAWRARMARSFGLDDAQPLQGSVGAGLARLLGVCDRLPGCGQAADAHAATRINLLSGGAGGAPNVVSLSVAEAAQQGQKEIDESFVAMHIHAAQRLLFGAEDKVNSIVLQLQRTEQIDAARRRLQELAARDHLDLEVRDFAELTPFYGQAQALFRAIFCFIAAIMGVIVLFIVVNTMGMNVNERISEIGVTRAMGLRAGGVRRQFIVEGSMLGITGATVGVCLAFLIALLFNHAGFSWTPPAQTAPIPLQLMLRADAWSMIVGTWLALAGVATLAAWVPARRAAGLPVVEALRGA